MSSDQHIWYISILRVMRCWVTLTMTCIILFCLPCYSIPRSNCSFKKFSHIDARMECWYKWGRWIKYIFSLYTLQDYFFCLKWIQILYLLRNNDLQHFCTFFQTIKLSKCIKIKNSANIDRPRIKVFIESFDRCSLIKKINFDGFGNNA